MTQAIRYALLAGVLASSATQVACLVCTLVGTDGGLAITVDGRTAAAGSYRIEVVAHEDGVFGGSTETLALDFEVTPTKIECTKDPELGNCFAAGETYSLFSTVFDFGEEAPPLTFVFKIAKQGGDDIPPDRATIRILDGTGARLVEQTVEPVYETEEINGRGCGKTGRAETAIVIP